MKTKKVEVSEFHIINVIQTVCVYRVSTTTAGPLLSSPFPPQTSSVEVGRVKIIIIKLTHVVSVVENVFYFSYVYVGRIGIFLYNDEFIK